MSRYEGILKQEFFGGEIWVLRTKAGQAYQLQGKIPAEMEDKQVKVRGKASDAAFGIAMVGPILDVEKIELA
ncbi:MAG: hypothetical protein ACI9VR_004366 [Cognaticolwellia sp.]|jgi:hypothetical protein